VTPDLGWKGAESYGRGVAQLFDLWQDPTGALIDIFMNNFTPNAPGCWSPSVKLVRS